MRKPVEREESERRLDYLARVARSLADAHADANLAGGRVKHVPPARSLENQFATIFTELSELDAAALDRLPGVEWLLDNDYVVREAIAVLKDTVPDDGYRRLPVLATTSGRGGLRVMALADEVMNACGTPLDLGWVERFLAVYQTDAGLWLGELWALPSMLRAVALERLANATRTLLSTARDTAATAPEYSEAIASQVANLRSLASHDWNVFVESVSKVHEILCGDPADAYRRMDVASRNRYRYEVEVVARRTGRAELEVARQAVALAEDRESGPERERHVGFYLVDDGRGSLMRSLQHKRLWTFELRRWCARHMQLWYLGSIGLATAALLWWIGGLLPSGVLTVGLLLPVAAVLALTVAVSACHWLIGVWRKPQTLAKLDFEKGVPGECTTVIATPALLTGTDEIDRLVSRMEKNYLGNPDPSLRYALLTDFVDADDAQREDDAALLSRVASAVESLNEHHGSAVLRPFFLFHRPCVWNASEARYMGWERKRGKLEEFNRFLLGDSNCDDYLVVGNAELLRAARFVITLDADTQMPPRAAAALIGAQAHPLNLPLLQGDRVTAGYNVIQPRLEVDPEIVDTNRFTRAFAGDVALDLYTHAVSDAYQDLFGVGVFAGKGIYDVRVFERTLEGRVPENAILSHDLFEGLHGRVGLATDVVLFEDYPVNPLAFVRRAHRWIRGDWQLLPWLMPFVPVPGGSARNRFTLLDRWKMLDNLRRSLLAPATLLALVAAWTMLPGAAWLWTLGILGVSLTPLTLGSVHTIGSGVAQGGTLSALAEHLSFTLQRDGARWLYSLAYLP